MSNNDEIVAAHGDAVWRTAMRLLSNAEDARDCYQQTFLDALRLPRQSVDNWQSLLCSIATRRALDQLRKRYQHRKIFAGSKVEACVEAPPDRRLMDEEFRGRLRRALASLPQQQAEAFWLRHVERQPPNEIAQALDIGAGHVRVLVHRAIQRLRVELAPTFGCDSHEEAKNEHK